MTMIERLDPKDIKVINGVQEFRKLVKNILKAGEEMGAGYMPDPESARLAVEEDLKTPPIPPIKVLSVCNFTPTSIEDFE